jgi:hypothetical protein
MLDRVFEQLHLSSDFPFATCLALSSCWKSIIENLFFSASRDNILLCRIVSQLITYVTYNLALSTVDIIFALYSTKIVDYISIDEVENTNIENLQIFSKAYTRGKLLQRILIEFVYSIMPDQAFLYLVCLYTGNSHNNEH